MNTFDLTLDLSKRGPFQSVPIRQGDKNGTIIRATITDHGVAVSMSGLTARFVMRLPDNEHYYRETATLSGSTATVTIDEAQAASAAGRTDVAYFQLLQGTDVIASTESFTVVVLPDALADATVPESYDSAIQEAIDNANEAAEEAREAALGIGYLKRADAEATYAHKSHKHAMADVTGLQAALDAMASTASDVSALGTRMDDAESSIAELAKRLPIYYYTDVPSESSITEKPQLAVIKGGAVYLVE